MTKKINAIRSILIDYKSARKIENFAFEVDKLVKNWVYLHIEYESLKLHNCTLLFTEDSGFLCGDGEFDFIIVEIINIISLICNNSYQNLKLNYIRELVKERLENEDK